MGTLCAMLALASSLFIVATAYLPVGKEPAMTETLFREVIDRMSRDLADSYFDYPSGRRLEELISRSEGKDLDESGFYADSPSLRDQEYLPHSTLWGRHFLTGGNEEAKDRIGSLSGIENPPKVKSDASLPAYCDPPNPCPIDFTGNDGCLEKFENTAAFSRSYQAAQDCMCDSEHMFDCTDSEDGDPEKDSHATADNNDLMIELMMDDQHKNLVAKKFHLENEANPFLLGEKLPVAAKKGNDVGY